MSNSDVMSGFGLWVYPTVGMVIFMIVFIVAMMRVLGRQRREEIARGGHLPLADDSFEPGSGHVSAAKRGLFNAAPHGARTVEVHP
ncbi:MAG: hypothetical protein K2W85_17150 [Phycisphaerales bacterium]|nr:hypothetical protein [Phycisphaerales bacterium]